ncbi:hypothetical protein HWV62_42321 [Athelia sp. TMB]|nr:hypothetical protein HWV62_42321 [Athelia sp. TMB]
MFANRVISFFFLIATLGLFAYASPIEISTGLQARDVSPNVSRAFQSRCDCKCTTEGCNEEAILEILTNLQATIDVSLGFFDGVTNPAPYAADICAAISAAITLLEEVDVNVSTAGALVGDIVNIIIAIILALAKCVSAYGLVIAATLTLQFDASLSALVNVCVGLIPGLTALLSSG